MTATRTPSLVDPVQYNDTCRCCQSSVDTYLSNAQRRYFDIGNPEAVVCSDCLSVYADRDPIQSLFDRIRDTLCWADQWKWESASFEDKFRYAIRVERLRESGGWAAVISDPARPKLPDTAPPRNAAYQTALERVLDSWNGTTETESDRPVAIDLFSGAGGAALGMLDAGFTVTGLENDQTARLTHSINLEHTIKTDLSAVSLPVAVPDPHWLHGSPPCKGFSRAGLQNDDDERNQLTWNTVEWIDELQPTVATIEQVPGFQDGGHDKRLRSELTAAGYDVAMETLNAADFGVPQTRKRLFIVAVRTDHPARPSHPTPTHAESPQRTLTGTRLDPYRTVGDVLPLDTERAYEANHHPPSHTDRVRERFSRLDPGQNVTDLDDPGTNKASQRRLDPDQPAPTITGVPADYVHPTKDRCLTNRELARLQSFPDWFRFTGPKKGGGGTRGDVVTQPEQIGNAVPPKMMKAIGEHVAGLLTDGS